jgi:hypothetical protein
VRSDNVVASGVTLNDMVAAGLSTSPRTQKGAREHSKTGEPRRRYGITKPNGIALNSGGHTGGFWIPAAMLPDSRQLGMAHSMANAGDATAATHQP